jgi:hypothetical protein
VRTSSAAGIVRAEPAVFSGPKPTRCSNVRAAKRQARCRDRFRSAFQHPSSGVASMTDDEVRDLAEIVRRECGC